MALVAHWFDWLGFVRFIPEISYVHENNRLYFYELLKSFLLFRVRRPNVRLVFKNNSTENTEESYVPDRPSWYKSFRY